MKEYTSVRIRRELWKKIKHIAVEEERSISDIIEEAGKEWLKKREKNKK